MKVCPRCGGQFPDSYILCKEDGFPLLDGSSELPVPGPERALVGDNEPTAVKTPPPVAVLAPQPSLAPASAATGNGDADADFEYDDTTNRIDGDTDAEAPPSLLDGQAFNLVAAEDAADLETTRRRTPSSETAAPDEAREPEEDSLEPERALPSPNAARDLAADEGPTEVVDHDEPTSINPAAAEAVAARMGLVPDPAEQPARLPPVQKPEVILQVREVGAAPLPAPALEQPTVPAAADEEPTTPAGFEAVNDSAPTPVLDPSAAPGLAMATTPEPTPVVELAEEPSLVPTEEPTPYIEPAAGPSPASIMELNPLALAATQPVTDDTEPMQAMPAPPEAQAPPEPQAAAPGPARTLAEAQAQTRTAAVTPRMTQEVDYVYTEQPEAAVFGRRRRVLLVIGGIAAAAALAVVIGITVSRAGGPDPAGGAAGRSRAKAAATRPDATSTARRSPDAAPALAVTPDAAPLPVDAAAASQDLGAPPPDAAAAAPDVSPAAKRAVRRRRVHRRHHRRRRRGKRRGRRGKRPFEGLVDPYAR